MWLKISIIFSSEMETQTAEKKLFNFTTHVGTTQKRCINYKMYNHTAYRLPCYNVVCALCEHEIMYPLSVAYVSQMFDVWVCYFLCCCCERRLSIYHQVPKCSISETYSLPAVIGANKIRLTRAQSFFRNLNLIKCSSLFSFSFTL